MLAAETAGSDVYLNKKLADAGLAEALVGHLDVGVCVVDAELRVVAINGLARRILGFPADLIRPGLTLEALIRYNAARGDFGEGSVDDMVRERLELARTVEADSFEFTQEDGSPVYVRRSLLPSGGFITTYSGKPARQDGDQDFDAALARLRGVVANMEQGVIFWNAQQCCELVNERVFEMLDLDETHLTIDMPRSEFLEKTSKRGDMSDDQLRLVTKSFAEGEKFRFDRKSPSGRTITTDVQPRSDGGFVVTLSDVTEQRKREADFITDRNEALLESKKHRQFIAGLDQEIRGPVKDLIGKAELLAKGELDDKQQYLADTVVKSGLVLLATVGSALGQTGVKDGKVSVEVAEDAVDAAEQSAEQYIAAASDNVQQEQKLASDNDDVESKDDSSTEVEQQDLEPVSDELVAEKDDVPPVTSIPGDAAKILIAEDNVSNQEVFLELLEGTSYEVTTVQDGREAVVQYITDSAKFDVIVMDLNMPKMGGIAATEAIRAHEKVRGVPKIPIIGVSAFATDEHREQAELVGMNEYITKPLDIDHFLECLTQCASERRLQDLKEKALIMAEVSDTDDAASTLSIADIANKYKSS